MILLLLSWLSSSFCKTDPINNDRGKLQSLRYFSATKHENVPRICAQIDALDGIGANYFLETRNGGFPHKCHLWCPRQGQLCFCVHIDRVSKYPSSNILMLKSTMEKLFKKYPNSFANAVLLIPSLSLIKIDLPPNNTCLVYLSKYPPANILMHPPPGKTSSVENTQGSQGGVWDIIKTWIQFTRL